MIERVAAARVTRQLARLQLTFACELDAARLTTLVAAATVMAALHRLGARVALVLSDLSVARADAVRVLNAARIPLMPYEDGYYFTIDNASRALARYDEWRAWTARHGLVWADVGLDIEPEARVYEQIMRNAWGLLPMIGPRLFAGRQLREAQVAYAALVARIRADGYRVENYQFPLITDERRAGSTLLQRLLGVVDVATDREVWMLYSSVMRRIGPGPLWVGLWCGGESDRRWHDGRRPRHSRSSASPRPQLGRARERRGAGVALDERRLHPQSRGLRPEWLSRAAPVV